MIRNSLRITRRGSARPVQETTFLRSTPWRLARRPTDWLRPQADAGEDLAQRYAAAPHLRSARPRESTANTCHHSPMAAPKSGKAVMPLPPASHLRFWACSGLRLRSRQVDGESGIRLACCSSTVGVAGQGDGFAHPKVTVRNCSPCRRCKSSSTRMSSSLRSARGVGRPSAVFHTGRSSMAGQHFHRAPPRIRGKSFWRCAVRSVSLRRTSPRCTICWPGVAGTGSFTFTGVHVPAIRTTTFLVDLAASGCDYCVTFNLRDWPNGIHTPAVTPAQFLAMLPPLP